MWKRCDYCNKPFEPKNDKTYCPDCRNYKAIEIAFGKGAVNNEQLITRYPDLTIRNSIEWKEKNFEERKFFLYPILPEASITLVAGEDGSGKTMFCMGIMDALTKGLDFGPWQNQVGEPLKCLYIDGEMHPYDLSLRLNQMDTNLNFNVFSTAANYMEENSDRGNLTQPEYREALTYELLSNQIKFVVIDNLASLAPGINENTKIAYDPINQWLLTLRHMGITVFVVHHLGKGGEQRGTSAREDNVDSILYVKKPKNYNASDGARFGLHFDKFRGRVEDENRDLLKDRVLWYKQNGQGEWVWDEHDTLLESSRELLKDLVESGETLTRLAEKHHMSQPTVTRRKQKFIEMGYIVAGEDGNLAYTEEGQEWLERENSGVLAEETN
jgi:hypothetical protein